MKNDSSIQNVYSDIQNDLSASCIDAQSTGKCDADNIFYNEQKFK